HPSRYFWCNASVSSSRRMRKSARARWGPALLVDASDLMQKHRTAHLRDEGLPQIRLTPDV
ncbi:MAG TPA: hypothetical protein VGK11_00695, partial [Actinomycetota bacterium]